MNIEILKINSTKIMAGLRELGINRVEVSYAGEGDSGAIDSISVSPADLLSEMGELKVSVSQVQYFPEKCTAEVQMPLTEAISELCTELLELEYSGWGNNGGANGLLEIDVELNKFQLTHNTVYVETECYQHEYFSDDEAA